MRKIQGLAQRSKGWHKDPRAGAKIQGLARGISVVHAGKRWTYEHETRVDEQAVKNVRKPVLMPKRLIKVQGRRECTVRAEQISFLVWVIWQSGNRRVNFEVALFQPRGRYRRCRCRQADDRRIKSLSQEGDTNFQRYDCVALCRPPGTSIKRFNLTGA